MSGPAIQDLAGVWRHGEVTFPERGQPYDLTIFVADAQGASLLRSMVGKPTGLPCEQRGVKIVKTVFVTVEQ